MFCPLASGSKGNCLFLGTENTRILIDAGLSGSQTVSRLEEIGVDIRTIQAILITHEHTDHIKGLPQLTEKYKIPVLANAETAKGIYAALSIRPRFKIFTTGETFQFGDLNVHPFSIPHDTLDPVAFAIQTADVKVGICADVGYVTSMVLKQLEKCDILYFEANHEVSMVHSSARPKVYKDRVLSRQGHLSNEECAHALSVLVHPGLRHVYLAHLSSECNTPEVALRVVGEKNPGVELSIAHQDKVSRKTLFKENAEV